MEVDTFPSNLVKYVSSLSSLLRRAVPKLPHALLHKKILGLEALEEQKLGREQKESREQKYSKGNKDTRGQSESSEQKESRNQKICSERIHSYPRTPDRPPKPYPGLKVSRKRTRRRRKLLYS